MGTSGDLALRLARCALDAAVVGELHATVDRLCRDYVSVPAPRVLDETRFWSRLVEDALRDAPRPRRRNTSLSWPNSPA